MIAQNASGNTALHLCALYNQVRTPTNTHTHSPFSTPSDMLSQNIHFRRFLNKRYAVVYIIVHFYNVQWGKKVFSQPPIVQVLPLKKMREACNIHHRYTSTMRDKIRRKKSRKSHCRIFKEFICKLWWKISIWSPTNKQDCWLSQTCNFFFKRLLCPPLVTCINGICLNSLSV